MFEGRRDRRGRYGWKGNANAPVNGAFDAGSGDAKAGAGAGILTTVQQVANALGVALIGNLFDNAAGSGAADAFPRAFALCLIVLALLVLAVAALVRLLPGRLAVMPEPATVAV